MDCSCSSWLQYITQTTHRYAYSEEVGEDSDDEEAQSLTKGNSEGDLSLVKQEKEKNGDAENYDQDNDGEEDKRE